MLLGCAAYSTGKELLIPASQSAKFTSLQSSTPGSWEPSEPQAENPSPALWKGRAAGKGTLKVQLGLEGHSRRLQISSHVEWVRKHFQTLGKGSSG